MVVPSGAAVSCERGTPVALQPSNLDTDPIKGSDVPIPLSHAYSEGGDNSQRPDALD